MKPLVILCILVHLSLIVASNYQSKQPGDGDWVTTSSEEESYSIFDGNDLPKLAPPIIDPPVHYYCRYCRRNHKRNHRPHAVPLGTALHEPAGNTPALSLNDLFAPLPTSIANQPGAANQWRQTLACLVDKIRTKLYEYYLEGGSPYGYFTVTMMDSRHHSKYIKQKQRRLKAFGISETFCNVNSEDEAEMDATEMAMNKMNRK